MTIKDFATKYKLVTKTDELGELIIPGRVGKSHIYQYSKKRLAAVVMPPRKNPKTWGFAKKQVVGTMMILQNGDSEGTVVFTPTITEERRAIFSIIKVKKKKQISEEQRVALAERLVKARAVADSHKKASLAPRTSLKPVEGTTRRIRRKDGK